MAKPKWVGKDADNLRTKTVEELVQLYPGSKAESLARVKRKLLAKERTPQAAQPAAAAEPEPEQEPDYQVETAKDKKIIRLEHDILDLRRSYKHVLENTANIDEVLASIELNLAEREPVPAPPKAVFAKGVTEEHAVLLLGDLHIGEYVDARQTGGIAVYNLDVAKRRLDYTVDTAIEILKKHLSGGYRYQKLYVFLLGDLISGEIHTELEISNEVGVTQQKLIALDYLEYNIAKLCQEFPEVHITSVVGNHGRKKKEYYFKEKAIENNDYLISKMLQKIFKQQKNLSWNIPESYWAIQQVHNRRFMIMHGDGVKSWGGMPFYGLNREYGKWRPLAENTMGGFHDMIIGHFHTPNWFTIQQDRLIINGCLKGGDEYSIGALSAASDPIQMLMSVHPKHGITWNWPINSKNIR